MHSSKLSAKTPENRPPLNLPQKFDKGVYVFQSHPVLGVPTNSLAVFLSGRDFSFFHRFWKDLSLGTAFVL